MLESLPRSERIPVIPDWSDEETIPINVSILHLLTKESSTTNRTAESKNTSFFTYLSISAISFIIISGVAGNLLVLLAVKTSKKLQTISNVFIVNLSTVNLLFALGVLPFHIYTNLNQQSGLNPTLCKSVGLLDYTLTGTAIMTIILIAYNRYRLIGDYQEYRRYFSSNRVCIMLTIVWILPMLCLLPPLLEVWGRFGYVEQLATCNLHEDDQFFKDILLIVRTLTPSLLIIYYYMCICRTSKASQSRLLKKPGLTISRKRDSVKSLRVRNERHMTKMMLTIICVFVLSYFPCTITALIDLHHPLPKPYHLFCRLCIYFSSAINPVIYGLMNTQFSKAYKNIVCFRRKGSKNESVHQITKIGTISLKPTLHLQTTKLSNQLRKLSSTDLPADKIDLL